MHIARNLAEGTLPADDLAWWQPPGLVYALAMVFRVAGPGLVAPRVVQALVSSASCGLAFFVARRLFTKPVAFATASICALHGVLVFEAYELLPPTWILAADLAALWLLLVAADARAPLSAFYAGVAIGTSAVFAPTILPFGLLAAAWLRKKTLALALLAGIVLPIAPVTWTNWTRDHELVAISTNGGINFYIGNNPSYDTTLALRPGRHWEQLTDEARDAGAITPAASSSYFLRRGLDFYRKQPGAAAMLFLRKVYLYFDGPEIPRDTDLYAARDASPLLGALVWRGPPFFPDGLLVPLALAGCLVCWRERRRLFLAYALLATLAIVAAAFFVTSRYRVPAIPLFAMFAASAVARFRPAVAVAFLALVVPLNLPTREASASYAAELELYRGLAYMRYLGDPRAACEHLRVATAQAPSDERLWFELGNALDASHEGDPIDAWRRAATLDPWDSRARRRIAGALIQRGDFDGAIETLEANVAAGARERAHYAPDHLNLAFLYGKRRRWDRAVAELRASAESDPIYFRANIDGFMRSVEGTPGMDASYFRTELEALRGTRP